MVMRLISIDGSYLEGGGQIARTSVALSAVTEKPCKVINIRKGRKKPGLKAQHLKGIEAVVKLTNGKVKGLTIGSNEIEFTPGKIKGGKYKIDVGTAGSISLILQTLVPACLHADKKVELEIIGGTDVKWSPTMSYFEGVFCGNLKKMGIEIESKVLKTGFYPKGGGIVNVKILPCEKIHPVNWIERGEIKRVECWSFASKKLEKAEVAERQIKGFEEIFKVDSKIKYVNSLSTGTSITAHAHCNTILGACALGELGKKAEDVGKECAELLKKQLDSNACLDRQMADQILPYMALAGSGKVSVAEITKHARTNMWVIEQFLPVKFKIEGNVISI